MLLAKSIAGHDKGCLYVIIEEAENYYLVCDGKYKLLDRPKKKNKKHIQVINNIPANVAEHIKDGSQLSNEEIKRAIKLYNEK